MIYEIGRDHPKVGEFYIWVGSCYDKDLFTIYRYNGRTIEDHATELEKNGPRREELIKIGGYVIDQYETPGRNFKTELVWFNQAMEDKLPLVGYWNRISMKHKSNFRLNFGIGKRLNFYPWRPL